MGSGKSCLAHLVIDEMLQASTQGDQTPIAYFYCDGSSNETSNEMTDAGRIFCCLLKQLCLAYPDEELPRPIAEAWRSNQHKAHLDSKEAVRLIVSTTSDLKLLILIIDGLDESDANVQRQLLEGFLGIIRGSHCPVKLFISGRPEVEPFLKGLHATEIDVGKNNTEDILSFIEERIHQAAKDPILGGLYSTGSEDQIDAVKSTLQIHAQGMFLWAHLALNYLHRCKHFHAMARRLNELPRLMDLFILYDKIWERMHEDIDEVDKIAIRTLLTFALYGYRYPLNKGLLYGDADPQEGRLHYPAYAALFAVEGKTDCSWKLDSISRLCPDFVTVEKEYHYDHQISLRVQHVSVQEYLVQKQPLHFSFEAGHGFLATLCMDHWSGGEGLDGYSGMWWADHLRLLKGAAEKSGRRPLYSDENSLKESMLRFLGETESSPAFVNWCRSVIHWSDGRYDIMSRGIGMYWVSTPPSSIYARIALPFKS
jgi:hypothetical protein